MEIVETAHDLPAPADVVWQQLVDPTELPHWLGDTDTTPGQPLQEGSQFRLLPLDAPDAEVDCTVLHLDAPHEAVWTWEPPGQQPQLVQYKLVPLPDGGTRLRIRHSGLPVVEACVGMTYAWSRAGQHMDDRLHVLRNLFCTAHGC